MREYKIIVTGGMGYIGSHTVVELIASGYEVVIVDNLCNSDISVLDGIKEITGRDDIPFYPVDLKDEKATREFFAMHGNAAGVIHFAALKAVGESVQHPLMYYNNNLRSMINVIESMRDQDIHNLIFSSSCTVYGQPDSLPVTEKSPIKPAESPYGATKQMCETMLEDMTVAHPDFKVIALRYFNPIGAHKSALIGEKPSGTPNNLLPYLTQTAIGVRECLSVFGDDYNTPDGTAIRDYIHVSDIANAHVKALDRLVQKEQEQNYEVFNLGTGNGFSVLEVIQSFERSTGVKVNYRVTDRRPGDVECIYADTQLSNRKLNWKAERDLDEMTRSAWAWECRSDKK